MHSNMANLNVGQDVANRRAAHIAAKSYPLQLAA